MSRRFILIVFLLGNFCLAYTLDLKLPYLKGVNSVVTRGYGRVTHRGVDTYALDFAVNNCQTYGQPVLATSDGKVVKMEDWHRSGEKNSYGNVVVIDHSNNIFSLYGHLSLIKVKLGDTVKQGQQIGNIGNTGSCEGTACHPYEGAHLHFAVYQKEKYIDSKGREKERLVAYKPEPMSGFSDFKTGGYYMSDNELAVEEELHYCPIRIVDGRVIDIEDGTVEAASVSSAVQQQKEISFEDKYDAKLVMDEIYGYTRLDGETFVVVPGKETDIRLSYKNIGKYDWQKSKVSVNVTNSAMSAFYYNWLTLKRPAALVQDVVAPGNIGEFAFTIKAPEAEGFYNFGARPVVYENGFNWMGEDDFLLNIKVEKPAHPQENDGDQNAGNSDNSTANSENGSGDSSQMSDSYNPNSGGNDTQSISSYGVGGLSGSQDDSGITPGLETYLVAFPASITNKSENIFSFRGNAESIGFKCKIDDGEFADCVSPKSYLNLSEGSHVFKVKAISDNEEDPTPAEHTFLIDRTAPVKIADLQAQSLSPGEATVFATAAESDLSTIKIYHKQSENCSSENPSNLEGWSLDEISFNDGTKIKKENGRFEIGFDKLQSGENYCFAVQAVDLAGNISEISNVANAVINDSADHLVISEFKLWGESQFIELYNPASEDINLSDYSLQLLKDGDDKTIKIDFDVDDIIQSHGFFLAGGAEYISGISSDVVFLNQDIGRNFALYLAKTNSYLLDKNGGVAEIDVENVVDDIQITSIQEPAYSLERKAHKNSTSDSMLIMPDKYEGNGYDSDEFGNFAIRHFSQPQNSSSLKEPHKNEAPLIEMPAWNGKKYFKGEGINLDIEISDLEDGTVPDNEISWLLDGAQIGFGGEVVVGDLDVGRHNIIIRAIDADSAESSAEFSFEIAESGWSSAVKIPGSLSAYSLTYGALFDSNGFLHAAFMKESLPCADGDFCGNSIYYQKKEGEFLAEPLRIINLEDYGIEYLSDIDLLVDGYGTVHVIFTGENIADGIYYTYHASSLDDFNSAAPIFSGFYFTKSAIDNNSLYVAVAGEDSTVDYKKFVVGQDSFQFIKQENYQIAGASSISNYDFMAKDGKAYFAVLYNMQEGVNELPKQFEDGFPIMLAISIPSNLAVGYLESGEGGWSFEFLEDGFSRSTNIYFAGNSSIYIFANDYADNPVFLKQEGFWYRKNLEIGPEYAYGFNQHQDKSLRTVSALQNNNSELLWHIYDGSISRKISLADKVGADKNIDSAAVSYFSGNQGKEGIVFGDYNEGLYELYYMCRG